MKTIKFISIAFIASMLLLLSDPVMAGGPPPPPPGGGGSGDVPLEGGAPIGSGSIILLSLGVAYGSWKLIRLDATNNTVRLEE